ncbi:type II toxin-antitoxin system RelE/ParE family toxin [Sulfurovum sp. bin170]|uniref:type II toxin-antitoxin system RelE/ParE family toxin n=1 Tax=Sulfurovum sp. bin170 TaxID=2695268 RepID=UPI0013E05F6E|nr:type II toxin-antitoxin system RelE/ParE family toxin [Sulfurovum sp. bin170]NEW60359.1 type II toxin-antitoxin system RelE/ParE family toxin [Sulfurovum sp. bin170]
MKIVKSDKYLVQLKVIVRFIALDSPFRARKFKQELESKVKSLDNFPYKYRKSIHFKSEQIRDMIFLGYVIPYFVDKSNNQIVVIGIVKYQDGV